MGLKIGYYFEFRGSKSQLLKKINTLQSRFKELPVERVREIHEIKNTAFEQGAEFWESILGFAMLLNYFKGRHLGDDNLWDKRKERIRKSGNGLCFIVDIGPGCESFTVLFGRLGNGNVWRGMGCTKTQYAEQFATAHLLVIQLLDICKEQGILERVNDDGEYWETRDLEVLAGNINASTAFMKLASKALPHILGKNSVIIENAIDTCANYMHVKRKNTVK